MPVDNDDPGRLQGATVVGPDGSVLGTVSEVYLDNATGRPVWVVVRTAPSGRDVALVPLAAAALRGGQLHVPYDGEQLRSAPRHDPGGELSPRDEVDLYSHYGLSPSAPAADRPVAPPAPGGAADAAMTRSEERLRVRTEWQPAERVRLRKYVVTEYQDVTVEVRREEIRVEHLPPAGAEGVDDTGGDDPQPRGTEVPLSEEEIPPGAGTSGETVIVLHEERPVVRTETVPVERVRLRTETVTDHETVTGEVRREEIEVDTDPDGR